MDGADEMNEHTLLADRREESTKVSKHEYYVQWRHYVVAGVGHGAT